MNIRTEAEQIVFAARNLKEDDALTLIEARLKKIFIKGEMSGIEEVRQKIVASAGE